MNTLVIVPTYNEIDNLPRLAAALTGLEPPVDLLVIDDDSPDGTGQLADRLAAENDRVRVLHRRGKLGLGTAYLEGFRYALAQGFDRVVEMDADFSHRPEDLPRLLAASGVADVIIGSRWTRGGRTENWPFLRQVVSRGGSIYARLMLGLPVRDCTSGFKCFRREALRRIDFGAVTSNGFGFQVEMNHLCRGAGLSFAEVPIVFRDRTAGASKMSGRIFLEALMLVWRLRFAPAARRLGRASAV